MLFFARGKMNKTTVVSTDLSSDHTGKAKQHVCGTQNNAEVHTQYSTSSFTITFVFRVAREFVVAAVFLRYCWCRCRRLAAFGQSLDKNVIPPPRERAIAPRRKAAKTPLIRGEKRGDWLCGSTTSKIPLNNHSQWPAVVFWGGAPGGGNGPASAHKIFKLNKISTATQHAAHNRVKHQIPGVCLD